MRKTAKKNLKSDAVLDQEVFLCKNMEKKTVITWICVVLLKDFTSNIPLITLDWHGGRDAAYIAA